MERSEDFKTGLVRFSFTQHLFKPQEKDNGTKQYNCTLLIPKTVDLTPYRNAMMEAAVKEWGDKAKQLAADGLIKNPILDGDGPQGKNKKTGERHAGFEAHWFIRPGSGSDFQPKLVNSKVLPITSAEELYSGCYGYAVLNAYTWENEKNGKGMSFGISMAQKAKEGEKLGGGGGVDVDKWAEKIEDEGDAPEAAKTGKGAGGFFA